jgi:hypothetical protein
MRANIAEVDHCPLCPKDSFDCAINGTDVRVHGFYPLLIFPQIQESTTWFSISLDFSICWFPQWNSLRADGRVSEGRFDFFGSAQTSDRRTSAQKGLILSQLLAQVDVIIRFLGFATKNYLGQGDSLFFFWKKFGI